MAYYTTSSAAKAVNTGRVTIWRAISSGKLEADNIALPGAKPRYRIHEDNLRSWVEKHAPAAIANVYLAAHPAKDAA